MRPVFFAFLCLLVSPLAAQRTASPEQLVRWLKKFPEADGNGDGVLTVGEALAYRKAAVGQGEGAGRGVREPKFDPGWDEDRFPDHAVCYKAPEEIAALFPEGVQSYEKPADGALRIVGTGHSFMAPGYRTLPQIVVAGGYAGQPLLTHTSGGVTGGARYKWEQENGIFEFDGRPTPKLLASIANAEWEAMTWGPYYHDRPAFYTCWIDFCLKYNPGMKFYLSDAWPQLDQLPEVPESEDGLSNEVVRRLNEGKLATYGKIVEELRARYPGKIFIMPTSEAMTLAVEAFRRGELPGVEGIHRAVGDEEERALWRDPLGHLGPGLEWLEGYVFYATLYRKSPVLIEARVGESPGGFPGRKLHDKFREIAWQAVLRHPLSGVTDADGDGVGD